MHCKRSVPSIKCGFAQCGKAHMKADIISVAAHIFLQAHAIELICPSAHIIGDIKAYAVDATFGA